MIRVQSSTYPEPLTFNEWHQHLAKERKKIWYAKLGRPMPGNEDLIDIERDNE